MQQTEKYKLNLIETGDTFSPHPLNENMEKVEGQLSAVRAEAAAGDAALGQRLTVLEGHRVVCGSYVSTGVPPLTIQLGFTPRAVLLISQNTATLRAALALPGQPVRDSTVNQLEIVEGGFMMRGDFFNRDRIPFNYLALV